MTAPPLHGIEVSSSDDRVTVTIGDATWEGSAAEAERLITGLHYALARARPGTNIASVLVNGGLWGGKSIEMDARRAIDDMRQLVRGLSDALDRMAEQGEGGIGPPG